MHDIFTGNSEKYPKMKPGYSKSEKMDPGVSKIEPKGIKSETKGSQWEPKADFGI